MSYDFLSFCFNLQTLATYFLHGWAVYYTLIASHNYGRFLLIAHFPRGHTALAHCAGVLNLAFKMEGHMTFHLFP